MVPANGQVGSHGFPFLSYEIGVPRQLFKPSTSGWKPNLQLSLSFSAVETGKGRYRGAADSFTENPPTCIPCRELGKLKQASRTDKYSRSEAFEEWRGRRQELPLHTHLSRKCVVLRPLSYI